MIVELLKIMILKIKIEDIIEDIKNRKFDEVIRRLDFIKL